MDESKNSFPRLNLPEAALQVRETSQPGILEVHDALRHKYVVLTPEEWVRQHFTSYLIREKGYPAGLMANEVGLNLYNTRRRCDTVVYDRQGRPAMIVEYKAPVIPITQRVFEQIGRYNIVLKVKWLVVSNGLRHYCCRYEPETGTATFVADIPGYTDL